MHEYTWQRSSFCSSGNNCLEVAARGGDIAIRESSQARSHRLDRSDYTPRVPPGRDGREIRPAAGLMRRSREIATGEVREQALAREGPQPSPVGSRAA
ncbi:DUF397 domain-containing protein [Streptomyces sparsogenes]|nr:DUF397 domain-containing protein [Streptomyces sparsogenes]